MSSKPFPQTFRFSERRNKISFYAVYGPLIRSLFRNSLSFSNHHYTIRIHVRKSAFVSRMLRPDFGDSTLRGCLLWQKTHWQFEKRTANPFQDSNTIFEPPGHSERCRKHPKQSSPCSSRIRNTKVKRVNAQNAKRLISSLKIPTNSAFKSLIFRKAVKLHRKTTTCN